MLFRSPGKESPYRNRSIEENLKLFEQSKNKLTNDLIKQEMDNKLFNYYYVDFAKNFISNPNNKWRTIYFDELCELANNFNLKNINLIQKIEFKALKSKNKKIIQHLARIRINYHRTKVLIKELNRFPTFIYQKILNKRKINENKIIFESFSGNFYSDNPKYLYEYLYEHYSDNFEFVWVINDKYDRSDLNTFFLRELHRHLDVHVVAGIVSIKAGNALPAVCRTERV